MPYIHNFFNKISLRLKAFNIRTIPKMFYSLGQIIKRGKDKVKPQDQNNVVYKISCKDCPATYVGQTKRTLQTRINEHKRDSKKPSKDTPLFRHILETDHNFNFDEPSILDNESSYFKRCTSEVVFINAQTHGLNIQEDMKKLNSIYTPFFQQIKNIN